MAMDQFTVHGLHKMSEKESQLAAGEILAGLLRAYHHCAAVTQLPKGITLELLSAKIVTPLLRIMSQCPQESEDNWCSAIQSGLANSDPNNVEWFTQPILTAMVENLQIRHSSSSDDETEQKKNEMVSKQYISPEKQVRAMRYATEILISYGFRGKKEWRFVLTSLLRNVSQISFDQSTRK